MYTKLKNVQVVISLLKQNGIKYLVLSPGTRDVPLVHSVEQDAYFTCYSMVDERSAAYFALGLSMQLNEPVCLSCTSSTATSNYLPAVKEAYNKNVQLVLLTADRNNYLLKQGEDQLIVQDGMYGNYVRAAVNLPIVNNQQDLLYCIRKTNEALLELDHNEKGPVHINFQVQVIDLCREKVLPKYRMVRRISCEDETGWKQKKADISKFNRIMIIYGQSYFPETQRQKVIDALDTFCEKYNCVVSYESTSNIFCANAIKTCLVTEAMTDREFAKYAPDLVITMGNHFFSFLKYKLRNMGEKIEHWRVCEDGSYLDNFDALTTIFKCSDAFFLDTLCDGINSRSTNEYYLDWANRVSKVVFPDLKFSNFSAIRDLCCIIPSSGSLVHLTILNSLRLFNFLDTSGLRAFCNLGADGIDGGMSTFLGQASIENNLAFIITGDLSFFYDLNSSLLEHGNNIRVFLVNNFAGGEFHNNFGLEKIPTLNEYIAAGHKSKAKSFMKSTDFKYMCASNHEELQQALEQFIRPSNKAVLLEVFTDANTDSQVLKQFYSMNAILTPKEKAHKVIKDIAKKILKKLHLR